MAKSKEPDKGGRPSLYDPKYCQMLIDHMAAGKSFVTFSTVINVSWRVLYDWKEAHPEFKEAADLGDAARLLFLEELGTAMATGTLRRVSEETVVRDKDGKVVFDQSGKPVTEKKYEPVRGDSKAWTQFIRAHGRKFGYVQEVRHSGWRGGPVETTDVSEMTDDEIEKELAELEKRGI